MKNEKRKAKNYNVKLKVKKYLTFLGYRSYNIIERHRPRFFDICRDYGSSSWSFADVTLAAGNQAKTKRCEGKKKDVWRVGETR